jgi:hypothetical protein
LENRFISDNFAYGQINQSTFKILTIMKNLVPKINAEIAKFQENATLQLEKGNKAAGTRARKAALELSKLLKEFRKVSVDAAK